MRQLSHQIEEPRASTEAMLINGFSDLIDVEVSMGIRINRSHGIACNQWANGEINTAAINVIR